MTGDDRPREPVGSLVSLIMPVWRPRADWLRAAVASALAQRDCSIELLVVDDGNASPVAEMLADIADPRMRIVRIPHGGVSRARNAGIAEARGEFIRFIDSDDIIAADSTQRLLALVADDRTIAYGATEYCDAGMRPYKRVVCSLEGSIVPEGLNDFTVTLPSLLFPRRVVEVTGAWDETLAICEDWDFVQRALEHAHVRGETAIATSYRRHATSSVGTASIDAAERASARVVYKYVARHPEQRTSRPVRRARAAYMTTAGERYLQAGEKRLAVRRFTSALKADPASAARSIVRLARRDIGGRTSRLVARIARVVHVSDRRPEPRG